MFTVHSTTRRERLKVSGLVWHQFPLGMHLPAVLCEWIFTVVHRVSSSQYRKSSKLFCRVMKYHLALAKSFGNGVTECRSVYRSSSRPKTTDAHQSVLHHGLVHATVIAIRSCVCSYQQISTMTLCFSYTVIKV